MPASTHPHDVLVAPSRPPRAAARRVARLTARTVPWAMGTLAAGLRERGDIHPSQFKVLMTLRGSRTGVTPGELAERMQVSAPTVSSMVSVLERRGWVERRPDADDRRRSVLAITSEGRVAVGELMEAGVEQMADLLVAASPDELDAVERGMQALLEVLSRSYDARQDCRHGCRHDKNGGDAR